MLENYFKIAFRQIKKQKIYSFINISGFAVGLACCILLYLFVRNEWTFDSFHQNADKIFRVIKVRQRINGDIEKSAITSAPLGPALLEFPEVQNIFRYDANQAIIKHKGRVYNESIALVDPTLFKMFSFNLFLGDPNTALQDKKSIVLNKEMAVKYFGNENPLGKILQMEFKKELYEFTVTGVLDKIPENSSFKFNILIPISIKGEKALTRWTPSSYRTYIQLYSKNQATNLYSKFPDFIKKNYYSPPEALELQALRDIHFSPEIEGSSRTSNRTYSFILISIAFLILLLACINFINLSIAQSFTRIKEIGLRKVLGAKKNQLMKQFIGETIFLSLLALIFGLLLAELFLPTFNNLVGYNLELFQSSNLSAILFLVFLILFVVSIAGGYPAFLLSSFQPVEILRKKIKFGGQNLFSRFLVMFQFLVVSILILSGIIMTKQFWFMKNKNLGYKGSHVVVIDWVRDSYQTYKNEIINYSDIIDATSCTGPFGGFLIHYTVEIEGKKFSAGCKAVDYNFLELLDIELLEGRSFRQNSASDKKGSIIVNESFVNEIGLASPIGYKLFYPIGDTHKPQIIGVFKDFHFRSLREPIEPLVLYYKPMMNMFVKISSTNIQNTINFLEEKWLEINPDKPFNHYFLNEFVDGLYRSEERWGKIINYALTFSILISCLGLLGLMLLATHRRMNEISIRKVFGASILKIVVLLFKDFSKLVLLASVIAWPVAYYAMNQWLNNFAYRTEFSLWIFLTSSVFTFIIAFLTISFQAVRSARTNPVESLRLE